MRKLALLPFIFSCLLMVFSACNKDDDASKGASCATDGTFTFKLDGVDWSASTFQNTLVVAQDQSTGQTARRCDIRATNANGDLMILSFSNPGETDANCMHTGAYVAVEDVMASNEDVFFFTYTAKNSSDSFSATAGTLNLTSCSNKELKGTFTFEDFFGEKMGTQGAFSVCVP